MRAEGGKKGKGKRREKKRKQGGKNGDQNRFFRAHVFSYAQWSIFKYIRKTVSRLSRSYPLLFAIKILMVSQFGDFSRRQVAGIAVDVSSIDR